MTEFYTPSALADKWGCHPRVVLSLIKTGALPAIAVGRLTRVRSEDAADYEISDGRFITAENADVYIIRCGDFAKIGKASDVARRVASLQAATPHELEIIAILTEGNGHQLERKLHERFSEYRHRGEWFRIEGQVLEWISAGFVDR